MYDYASNFSWQGKAPAEWFTKTSSPKFREVQHYVVGPNTAGSSAWSAWGNGDSGAAAGLEVAVDVTGNVITYEIGVTPYDNYAGKGGSGTTDVTTLQAGDIVRFDVVVASRYEAASDPNNHGSRTANDSPYGWKNIIANAIQRYELGE